MKRWLPTLSVRRPVTMLVLFVALLVIGAIAWRRLPLQLMPDGLEPKVLWVRIPFANATPQETDELVVRPITEQLSTLAGLDNLRSRAGQDSAGFTVEFHPSVSMSEAYNDVVDRIERALPELPDGVDRYFIFKFNPSDQPVMWAGVTFPDDMADPYQMMNRVVLPRLERIPGVATVDTWGLRSRGVFIDYDRGALLSHGVDIGSVSASLGSDNFQRSGGRINDRGRVHLVRSLATIDSIDDLPRYPIKNGELVLDDIADISFRGVADADVDRVNGRNAAGLAIRKESSANTVEVAAAVRAELDKLRADPRTAGAEFLVFFDQGEMIEESSDALMESLLQGAALSVVILAVFLRDLRMTLLISCAIPFSMLLTLTVMYFRGGSLNLIAMMGLMLAIGMVVDNAIVVVEAIYRRRTEGQAPDHAAIEGTSEVNLAIIASTATSMVVFLPVILMSENADVAFFMGELGLPVVFALVASLFVALLFAPLATTLIRAEADVREPRWLTTLTRLYGRTLDAVLRRPADTTITALAGLFLTVTVAVPGVRCAGQGEGDFGELVVRFSVPHDASLQRRGEIAAAFETMVEDHREAWGIDVYRVEVGAHDIEGAIEIYQKPGAMPKEELIPLVQAALPTEIPGVTASLGFSDQQNEDTLTVSVFGEDMPTLRALADEVARRVRSVPDVLSARLDDEASGLDELRLHPDRAALERYGLTAQQVATTVAFAMRGAEALPPIRQGTEEITVESRMRLEDRQDIATLLDFPVFSATTGRTLPVRAITTTEIDRGPGGVVRNNRRTSMDVLIQLRKGAVREVAAAQVSASTADMQLPRGYSLDADAWRQDQSDQDAATIFALLMSVAFVYLLMGVLFESWMLPFAVITTIPMALLGAWWGLYLTDTEMDLMAGIGLVVLVGVVVNNGIVLIDRVAQARAEGLTRDAAIQDACVTRLRPILMTAMTTILGLVPMALGASDFVGIPYAPLGRCVIGGMTAATFLTLFFVPFFYTVLDDLAEWARQTWARARGGAAA